MLEEFNDWIRNNVKCCACGGSMEASSCINIVELEKVATWKWPVFGQLDVPDYEPRALAIICDECQRNKVKIQRCIEWEGSPYLVKYHNLENLADSNNSESQMNYYFGRLYKSMLLKRVRQLNGN